MLKTIRKLTRHPDLAEELSFLLKLERIPYQREQRVCFERKWRIDIVIIDYPIAVECEGGQWCNGAHVRGKHFESDIEKYNAIALSGKYLLRFNKKHIKSGYAVRTIKKLMAEIGRDDDDERSDS